MRKVFTAGILMLALSACNHGSDNKQYEAMVADKVMAPRAAQYKADRSAGDETDDEAVKLNIDTSKKLIKEGEINFETSNIKDTRIKILHSLAKLGGYLAEENETNNREDIQNTLALTLRVPSKNFDLLLDSISSNADKIDSKNISVKDVTAQYMDIKIALYNKKLLESRYQDLLKKADKVSDVLQIENKLTDIRTAIDSTQGQLNYLTRQVAYSTLKVEFYTHKVSQNTGYSAGYKFLSAIAGGWGMLQDIFFGLIGIWPVIMAFVILFVLLKRWRKRRRARKNQS